MSTMIFPRWTSRVLALAVATVPLACGDARDEGGLFGDGGNDGGSDGDDGADPGGTSGGSNGGDDGSGGGGDDGGGVRFDIGNGTGGPGDGNGMGCEKIDFLFVVDNSGSMADEQQNLANNFPRFMDVIQNTLQARDFHVMATDTDASPHTMGNDTCSMFNGVPSCTCDPDPACCARLCQDPQWSSGECNGKPCTGVERCDGTIGAGKTYSEAGGTCNIQSGHRYMLDDQPDLAGTFSCVAKVGTFGHNEEQPMTAMVEAVSPALNDPGGCNEGFVRDDAILVVTFITDEEDGTAGKSPGDPASWRQALVDAKGGNEAAVVVLGLIGDGQVPGGLPGGPCPAGAAEASPTLQSFVEQFPYGHLGSICAPDYSGFFTDAVDFIDTACEDFVPPG